MRKRRKRPFILTENYKRDFALRFRRHRRAVRLSRRNQKTSRP